jgi:hypothetical protein
VGFARAFAVGLKLEGLLDALESFSRSLRSKFMLPLLLWNGLLLHHGYICCVMSRVRCI